MSKLGLIFASGVLVAPLFAGCADYSVGYYGPGPVADIEYDGYYDGYYGQIYDGYWGDNGVFFYRTGEGGRWSRGRDALSQCVALA